MLIIGFMIVSSTAFFLCCLAVDTYRDRGVYVFPYWAYQNRFANRFCRLIGDRFLGSNYLFSYYP